MVATTMCPTYKATRREHASPRAKANLLRSVISGALDPASTYGLAATKAVTDYCIVCGMCAVECPSNVNIPKLMLEAKSKYREAHRGDPVELILGRPEMVSRLGSLTAPLSNRLISRPLARRLAETLTGIDRRRIIAPFASTTFLGMNPRNLGAASERRAEPGGSASEGSLLTGLTGAESLEPVMTVAYFYDLFALYNDPELALATMRVLAAHGIRVILPEQRASGIPEMLYGYARRAGEAARFNMRTFAPAVHSGAIPISTEPTASFAFKVHYPDYVPSDDSSLVANAFRDLGEFLVGYRSARPESSPPAKALCRPGRETGKTPSSLVGGKESPACENQPPRRMAYHQPCHLKAQQIGNPALELMSEIPDLEIVDLDAGCCGMAGTFGMKRGTFDLSMRTGAPLFERITDVAPTLVASECSTCRMQISQATGLETVHPVTLLDEAYR
jgi:Fe-S oxidoreductase